MKRANTVYSLLTVTGMLASAASIAGCDWRKFDDLADQTWVDVSTAPEPLTSRFFGAGIASAGNQGAGANFMVVGRSADGIGHFVYAADGSKDTTGFDIEDFMPDPLPQRPVFEGDRVGGFVGLAIPAGSSSSIALYNSDGGLTAELPQAGLEAVTALGFGATDSDSPGPETRDAVYVRGVNVELIGSYTSNPVGARQCRHGRAAGFAVAVGELDATVANGEEIVLGIGNANMANAASDVIIMRGSVVEAAHVDNVETDCFADGRTALMSIVAPGGEPDFGADLVIADFDGNDLPDLAASAPSGNVVYIFFDINAGTGASTQVDVSGPGTSTEFGLSIAAGDLDGDGSDELVVGDRSVAHDGKSAAGSTYIYTFAGTNPSTPSEMFDNKPEQDEHFGTAVGVVAFGTSNIVVVGADGEAFTYFRTLVSDDVRAN